MLNNQVFYHGILRKTIIGFGRLFSDVYIDRKKDGSVEGTTVQRLQIPLAYAPKEKWLVRVDSDPTLENHTYVSLPRMSFEITGYTYDASRKTNRMNKVLCNDDDGASRSFVYSPVPYNIDISLYVLTKTQEDAMQIIEQILPTFTPEYTLSLNMIKEMNIIENIPIILNSVTVQDEYEGDFQTRRFVVHTLNFTVKANIFGYVSNEGVISTVMANTGQNPDFTNPSRNFIAAGDTSTKTIVDENWTFD